MRKDPTIKCSWNQLEDFLDLTPRLMISKIPAVKQQGFNSFASTLTKYVQDAKVQKIDLHPPKFNIDTGLENVSLAWIWCHFGDLYFESQWSRSYLILSLVFTHWNIQRYVSFMEGISRLCDNIQHDTIRLNCGCRCKSSLHRCRLDMVALPGIDGNVKPLVAPNAPWDWKIYLHLK